MELMRSTETSVHIRTIRHYIPEDDKIQDDSHLKTKNNFFSFRLHVETDFRTYPALCRKCMTCRFGRRMKLVLSLLVYTYALQYFVPRITNSMGQSSFSKPNSFQPFKKFKALHGVRRFIIVATIANDWSRF
jgi:hypothetical protein